MNQPPPEGKTEKILNTLSRDGFWSFNVGHLLTLLGMMAVFFGWFLVYDRQINSNTIGLNQLFEISKSINERVSRLDERDTMPGRDTQVKVAAHDTRITANEVALREILPKMTRIEIKLDDLSENVRKRDAQQQDHKP
jgi:hypothetical protein